LTLNEEHNRCHKELSHQELIKRKGETTVIEGLLLIFNKFNYFEKYDMMLKNSRL